MNDVNSNDGYFDVVIIGAGINGAGIARDAASRNLRVLLLDKDDISGGTSSRSTRLIHGGLRYLEHGELSLVRESLREREILLQIAPHLVKPLIFMIPTYKDSRRGKCTIRIGMFAYHALSYDRSLPGHKMLSRNEVLARLPTLNSAGLTGGALFYDAQIEFAERFVLENVLSAAQHGAVVVTHAPVEGFEFEDRTVKAVRYRSNTTHELKTAQGKMFINASGPWVDQVLSLADHQSARLIGGTKGSHIVVDSFPDAPDFALYVEAHKDRRSIFIIPWNGSYLIGTTDLRFAGDLDDVEIDETEVDYLLSEINRLFPTAKLTRDKILYSYAGVRPLPFSSHNRSGSITRRHFIKEHRDIKNLFSIVGGKLTTYRSLAEEVVDLVLERLGETKRKCVTSTTRLPGAQRLNEVVEALSVQTDFSKTIYDRLLRVYGSRATQVIDLASSDRDLAMPLRQGGAVLSAEVVFAFEKESAASLMDCLMRRTMSVFNSDLGLSEVVAAADIGEKYCGWSAARSGEEVSAYRSYVQRFALNYKP